MLQSGVRSSILPGLPTHLVQELNVGNVLEGEMLTRTLTTTLLELFCKISLYSNVFVKIVINLDDDCKGNS